MKINNLGITSPESIFIESTSVAPICLIRGRYSDLALDLIRELIGDFGAQNDPDRIDDGRFVIFADVSIDEKDYSVSYLRNVDFMGDHCIAVNFRSNSTAFSKDDTHEFNVKCNKRNKDTSNILIKSADAPCNGDDRPIFIYDYFDRLDEAIDTDPIFNKLASTGRQVFISVCAAYPCHKIKNDNVRVIDLEPSDLPDAGTAADDIHTVILCPVCGNKALDNYGICAHCGWEHDGFPEDHYSAANRATLKEYRENFLKTSKRKEG